MLAVTWLLVASEGTSPCPPGGPLALDCGPVQGLILDILPLAAVLYVAFLSAVAVWSTRGAGRRPVVDASSSRDWYLVAAVIGVPLMPLLAFTILAGLGRLG